jgi:hypothetical protein
MLGTGETQLLESNDWSDTDWIVSKGWDHKRHAACSATGS